MQWKVPHPIREGMLSSSIGMPSRREGPPSISGNVFVNPDASSSAPYPQELHQWNSSSEEPLHSSTVEKSGRRIKIRDASLDRQPKFQSSSVEETLQRIMGQTNNDCRDSRLRYVLAHNFLRKLCCGSKKWRWLIQWMV